MRAMMKNIQWAVCVVALIAVPQARAVAQTRASTGAPSAGHSGADDQANTSIDAATQNRMQQQAIKAANEDRHKRLAADVARLLELSTELKADVDKTSKDQMSVEVIRKAAEIEKLAHDVKQRMTN